VDEHKTPQNEYEAIIHVYFDHIFTLNFLAYLGVLFGYFGA